MGGVTPFTATNPSGAGSSVVTLGGSAGITGSFAVTTVTDDQVGVTASIDPSITFNVGAQAAATPCAGSFAGNGGSVGLGTLRIGAVASSDLLDVQANQNIPVFEYSPRKVKHTVSCYGRVPKNRCSKWSGYSSI